MCLIRIYLTAKDCIGLVNAIYDPIDNLIVNQMP